YAVHNIIYSALTHPVFFFLSLHDALPIFFLVGVQIRELNAIVVPVEVHVIVEASLADSPPGIQAEAAAIVGAAQRGKGRSLIGVSTVVVETEIDVIVRPVPATSSAAPATTPTSAPAATSE